jgi:FK506-binding nuclear protein
VTLTDANARTTLKLMYLPPSDEEEDDEDPKDDEVELKETVLCSLTPGKASNATCCITVKADIVNLFSFID